MGLRRSCFALILLLFLMFVPSMAKNSIVDAVAQYVRNMPWPRLVSRKELLRQCYGKYGCYSIDYPWFSTRRLVNLIPKSPKIIRPYFQLYNRPNTKRMQPLAEGRFGLLQRSTFDPKKMTFVITHGYLEHGMKNWLQQMKDELLEHGDHNVIILDWLNASHPPYTQAVANIRLIGVMAAHFLAFMVQAAELDLMHTHLVGHSLGAHLSGYIGSTLQRDFSLTVGRITGLDPAEPHFEHADPIIRLDSTDAYFVDVIHTDANPILSLGLGLLQPSGHLDFYPNGGKIMAGCDGTVMGSLAQEDGNVAYALRRLLSCNHIRAYEYFIESINSECPFLAVECPDYESFIGGQCDGCLPDGDPHGCEYMGFKAFSSFNGSKPTKAGRRLYLLTEAHKPFCSYHYRVTIVLSDTTESIRQGGDRGNFFLVLHGEDVSSDRLKLTPQEAFFEPGRVYHFMTTTRNLGHVKSADLVWEYSYHPFNPLTWRILSDSKLFVNRIDIEEFGGGKRHTFCGQDRAFFSGKSGLVRWQPNCRENNPQPAATFLGTVLNADPLGNAEFIIDQVNPLSMNPLNGLANIGLAFRGFSSGIQSMTSTIRRIGSEVSRSMTLNSWES